MDEDSLVDKYMVRYITTYFFLFMIFIIIFVFYCPSLDIINEVFIQLENNFKLSPIMNLNKDNCGSDNSINILGEFEGIPEGRIYTKSPLLYCSRNPMNFFVGFCKGNAKYNYDICEENKNIFIRYDKQYCKNVSEIKGRQYYKFNGCELCSMNNFIQLNYDILIKNSTKNKEECLNKKDMKVCGNLDDLNQTVCLNKNIECPLNDIIINNQSNHEETIDNNTIIYESFLLNNNFYIHYTNKNVNKKIISGFNVSLGYPCSHLFLNHKRNNLFIGYDFIYCSQDNNLSQFIFNQNSTQFFKDNGLYDLFKDFNLTKLNNFNSSLYILNYPGIEKDCYLNNSLHSNSFSSFIYKRKIFKILFIFQSIFSFISNIPMFFVSVFAIYYIYPLIHSIILLVFFIFFIINTIIYNQLVSPLNCMNNNGGLIKKYLTYQKDIKTMLVIQFIYFIFATIGIIIETYIARILKNQKTKSDEKKKIAEEKNKNAIKEKLQNDFYDDNEMKINL